MQILERINCYPFTYRLAHNNLREYLNLLCIQYSNDDQPTMINKLMNFLATPSENPPSKNFNIIIIFCHFYYFKVILDSFFSNLVAFRVLFFVLYLFCCFTAFFIFNIAFVIKFFIKKLVFE